MKIGLADNWRVLHRRGTVLAAGAFGAITALGPALLNAWAFIPQDLKDALPHGTARIVATVAFALIIVVRYTAVRKGSEQPSSSQP